MAFTTTTLTNTYALGKDGVLTVGGETMGGVKSVSISYDADEIDVTTRDDNSYSKSLPGKRSVSIDVEYNKSETDAAQVGMRTLWLGNDYSSKGVSVTCKSGTNGYGFSGTFVLTSMKEDQDMDDVDGCTMSLRNFGAVTQVTPSAQSGGAG